MLHELGHHRVRRASAGRRRVHQGRVRVRVVRLHTGRHGRGGHVFPAAAGRIGRHVAQLSVVLLLVVDVVAAAAAAASPSAPAAQGRQHGRVHRGRNGRRRRRWLRRRRLRRWLDFVHSPRTTAAQPQQRRGRRFLTRGLWAAAGRDGRGHRPETAGSAAIAATATAAQTSPVAAARVRRL